MWGEEGDEDWERKRERGENWFSIQPKHFNKEYLDHKLNIN